MIIFDLDGTLANCEHRRHFVERYHPTNENRRLSEISLVSTPDPEPDPYIWKPNWPAFYEACDQDEPVIPVIKLYYALGSTYGRSSELHIWSGRCESVREKTLKWIYENIGVAYVEFNLKMRPTGDNTPDDLLKERWLDEAIAEGNKIDFVFDDRPKVIRMWQRRGVFVFNCCQHDKEF